MDVDVRKIENNSEATARRRVFNYNWKIYKLARNYDYSLSIVSTGPDDSGNPRFYLGFPDETFNMFVGCKNLSNTH